MPCFIGCLALATPRLALFLVYLFNSPYIHRAFDSFLWPVLGFIFMPLTALAYAWAINSHGSVEGFPLVVVVGAVLMDLGFLGGGGAASRRANRK
jgi:hypothetical protein